MPAVCRFYLKGYCRYGKNCKFEHPGEENYELPGGFSFTKALEETRNAQRTTVSEFSFTKALLNTNSVSPFYNNTHHQQISPFSQPSPFNQHFNQQQQHHANQQQSQQISSAQGYNHQANKSTISTESANSSSSSGVESGSTSMQQQQQQALRQRSPRNSRACSWTLKVSIIRWRMSYWFLFVHVTHDCLLYVECILSMWICILCSLSPPAYRTPCWVAVVRLASSKRRPGITTSDTKARALWNSIILYTKLGPLACCQCQSGSM